MADTPPSSAQKVSMPQPINPLILSRVFLILALAIPEISSGVTSGVTSGVMEGGLHGGADERYFATIRRSTVMIETTIPFAFNEEQRGVLQGTGFLVDSRRGWILTNAHVAGRSPSRNRVSFDGLPPINAKKVYVDPSLDVAILSIPTSSIPDASNAAQLSCDDTLQSGHSIGTVGYPDGLVTVTRGIVSGHVHLFDEDYLQIDAPINPGNSGGPLVDMDTGQVVGINTARKNGSQNMNFSIPISQVCGVLHLLQSGVDPAPPILHWVFYQSRPGDPLKIARIYDPSETTLLPDDIIVSANGTPAAGTLTGFLNQMRGLPQPVFLGVMRHGKLLRIQQTFSLDHDSTYHDGFVLDGALVGWVGPSLASQLGVSPVGIHWVESGSPAEEFHLEKTDFIVGIDSEPLIDPRQAYKLLYDDKKYGRLARLSIQRFSQSSSQGLFIYLEKTIKVEDLQSIPGFVPAGGD